MERRPLSILLLAVCLVAAGCSGLVPAGDDTSTPTPSAPSPPSDVNQTTDSPTPDGSQTPSDGASPTPSEDGAGQVVLADGVNLSYNASLVMDRVERLRGLDLTANVTVRILRSARERPSPHDLDDAWGRMSPSTSRALLLYSNATATPKVVLGMAGFHEDDGYVAYVMNASVLEEVAGMHQEAVLAHEFAHVLQIIHDSPPPTGGRPETTDELLATSMDDEGDATVVEQQYRERYLEGGRRPAARNDTPTRADWSAHVSDMLYYEGYRRLASQNESVEERSTAFRTWPTTSAGVLYGAPARPEGTLEAPTVEGYERVHADRTGALVLRTALRVNGASYRNASLATDGWRNDLTVTYRAGDRNGTYLVSEWANASEAREFASAYRGALRARNATRRAGRWVVPAGDHAPEVHVVVRRDGSRVEIVASESASTTTDLANATA